MRGTMRTDPSIATPSEVRHHECKRRQHDSLRREHLRQYDNTPTTLEATNKRICRNPRPRGSPLARPDPAIRHRRLPRTPRRGASATVAPRRRQRLRRAGPARGGGPRRGREQQRPPRRGKAGWAVRPDASDAGPAGDGLGVGVVRRPADDDDGKRRRRREGDGGAGGCHRCTTDFGAGGVAFSGTQPAGSAWRGRPGGGRVVGERAVVLHHSGGMRGGFQRRDSCGWKTRSNGERCGGRRSRTPSGVLA
mmetsp:Transcript_5366/g.11790  ORF Transcript_5366/g.11790 Transcript_5366/m.11790 type:complete len:250 (+) Transcript_5366:735-1484(+)